MRADNLVVHGMWIGTALSPVEMLTMQSYMAQGHQFVLWHYDVLAQPVPQGVICKDAGEIIPREQVFNYKHRNQWGHGQGSYAGFSDIFRYKLLYEVGGWWTDMDVTCLKALDLEAEYVFREHDLLPVVGNVMKAPKGSALMLHCYEKATQIVNADNTNWLLPIEILNEGIITFGLSSYVQQDFSNADRWDLVAEYSHALPPFKAHWYVFHWMNEEWRSRGVDKHSCLKQSRLEQLYKQHGVNEVRYLANYRRFYKLWRWLKKWFFKGIGWLKQPGIPKFLQRK